MKYNLKNSLDWRFVAVLALLLSVGNGAAVAQWNQNTACPGWNNPMNFTIGTGGTGDAFHGWEGRTGEKTQMTPNAVTGETSVSGWTTVPANQMESKEMDVSVGSSYPDCARVSSKVINGVTVSAENMLKRAFTIMDTNSQCSGYPRNCDPMTYTASGGSYLKYVPTQYNIPDSTVSVQTQLSRSIRVGHACGRNSNAHNASGLNYYMNVTPQNAMMYIYYACVFENPHNNTGQDPIFIIRVMTQNSSGQWVQATPSGVPQAGAAMDTLSYMITGTQSQITVGQDGWHSYSSSAGMQGGSQTGYWKDWNKVSLNLSGFLYSRVRIEVMVSTCSMTQHYAYAYICGECRPMEITSSGCPAGMSTDVTTLTAPRGLEYYKWYASDHGASDAVVNFFTASNIPESTKYFRWRAIPNAEGTEADSAYRYRVQASDFAVNYRPNEAHNPDIAASPDSMGMQQAFRCEMTTYINPAKRFKANLYVNVQNTKPTMDIDTLSLCGGDVQLRNTSYVAGNANLISLDSTVWSFYNNPECQGTADTVITQGANVTMHFDGSSMRGVKVRSNIHEELITVDAPAHNACYSEAIYPLRPLPNPEAAFTVSDSVLCASDPQTRLIDITPNSTYRTWVFREADNDSTHVLTDTLVGNSEDALRNFVHEFPVHTDGVEPVKLIARNGLFYLNPVNQSDTLWCQDTATRTVNIFTNPQLERHGDSVVCQGDATDVLVTSDIENCTYQWSTSYGSVTGGLPAGPTLAVRPTADTATYFVLVTSPAPQNCQAWDSAHVFLVNPKLSRIPVDGQICPGDPVTLNGSNAHHYSWSASPADPTLAGQDTLPTVVVNPQATTTYTLVGHGSNDCNATPLSTTITVHPLPVSTVDLDPGIVDSENPTLVLRDVSPYSVSSTWTFAGAEVVTGQEVTHTFEEATGVDSVYVTLVNANDLGCTSTYPFAIPVNLYTAWFPNVFTPGSEDVNARFRLYTINAYEHFHIYIYNRGGQLVFDSDDPAFEWDGTMPDGSVCPQGTYMYVCRFRKPGAYTLMSLHGSVTLVR